jgi:hypothetical protein
MNHYTMKVEENDGVIGVSIWCKDVVVDFFISDDYHDVVGYGMEVLNEYQSIQKDTQKIYEAWKKE